MPNASAPALVCRGLRRSFDGVAAVDGVDLTVERGSLTALLGPSGCGKTTALRLVAGLLEPDAGVIEIDGRRVAGPGGNVPPERRSVGMVFQDYALFPHLSVASNVAYGLRGLRRRERAARVAEVLDLVDLAGLGDRPPTALSGGQQQRVALARALAPRPPLVLLDEPFSNLDSALRTTVREEVRRILREAGTTAIIVTHDQEEALSLADSVAVMRDGVIHQVDQPHLLYTRPATRFVAEFVGDADVLPARRAGAFEIDTALGRLPTVGEVPEDDVEMVLRPETVRLHPVGTGGARVDAVTYFGHDQLVALTLPDGTRIRSRQGPELELRGGDRVVLEVVTPVVVFPAGAGRPDARRVAASAAR